MDNKRTVKTEGKRLWFIITLAFITLILMLIFGGINESLIFIRTYFKWSLSLLLVHLSWIFLFGRYNSWQMYETNSPHWDSLFKARIFYYVGMMIALALIL